MANKFISKSIEITTGFALAGNKPLDSRLNVELYSDLTTMDEVYKYEGMTVYVKEHEADYKLINNVWVKQVKPEDLTVFGFGDMKKEVYATTLKEGYVDKAIFADKATNSINAENSAKFAGKTPEEFATTESVTKVAGDLADLQTDVENISKGSILVPTAKHSQTSDKATTAESADKATKLTTARKIAVTGDVNNTDVSFDGTADVSLNLALKNLITSGVLSGCKVTVNAKGLVAKVEGLAPSDIPLLTSAKISDLGSAATKDTGTSIGNVVEVNSEGKIDESLIPPLAIMDTHVVGSESSMLALSAQQGDICIRDDIPATFILKGPDPSVLDNWIQLKIPNDLVQSVNGKTGTVVLTTKDITESENLYYTEARATSNFNTNFVKTSVLKLEDGSKVLTTDDVLILNGGNA